MHAAFHFFQLSRHDPLYSTHNLKVGSRTQAVQPVRLEDGVDTVQGIFVLRAAILSGFCRSEDGLQNYIVR